MPFRKTKFELSPRLRLGVGRGYSQNNILKAVAIICLVLAVGLTVNAIKLIFRGNGQANQPEVLGAATENDAQSIEFTSYTVLKGDTLFNISQKFNISWTSLAAINNLKSPFYLKPGQTLKVPKQ